MEQQKDKSVAYQKKLSSYTQRPDEGTRFIIKKNLQQIVPNVIKSVNEFQQTNEQKYRSLCQLQHICLIAEGAIQPYLEQIIRALAKYLNHEEEPIQKKCAVIAEIIGIFIDAEIYTPLLITLFSDEESKNNLNYLRNLLVILSIMIQNENPSTIEPHLEKLVQVITNLEQTYQDNEEVLIALFQIDSNIINIAGETSAIYCRQLFTILLTVQATTKYGKQQHDQIDKVMLNLAKICGYSGIADLHANEVSILLQEFTENKSYMQWNKYSKDRFKFDVIVRNCKEGISKFMPTIIEIIQHNSNRDAEVEIKIDMLVLIEYLFQQDKLADTLKEYSVQLLQKVLIPSIVWKVGKTQTRTRKAGVINIIKMIDNDLITGEGVMSCIKELLPPIQNCLEDDYTPDLRFAACNLVERVFKITRDLIDYEHIFQFYTALLERLDDAQDVIRMEITKSFAIFFSMPCLKTSQSIFEYCVKALFIHLDDQNEEIQSSMYNCLRIGARFQPKIVLDEAKASQGKAKYPRRCTELINLASEIITDQSSENNNN